MIAHRQFRNSDPPHLMRIWNRQPPQRWLLQPMTLNRLEQLVFGRQFFRPEMLLLATRDDQPIGFAHTAFGPTGDGSQLDPRLGVISALFVDPDESFEDVAPELLSHAETLLRSVGAERIVAGGFFPNDPFYWGMYGGPISAGVPATDKQRTELFRQAGYRETRRFTFWERALSCFRPPVDRFQLQIKRRFCVEAENEIPITTWWDACIFNQIDRARYSLRATDGSPVGGSLTFWDTQPLGERQDKRVLGLLDATIAAEQFSDGMATFLMADSLRQFQGMGITHVEAVTPLANAEWHKWLNTLGFTELDQLTELEKT